MTQDSVAVLLADLRDSRVMRLHGDAYMPRIEAAIAALQAQQGAPQGGDVAALLEAAKVVEATCIRHDGMDALAFRQLRSAIETFATTQPQVPEQPDYWFADCDDSDYSALCNSSVEASTLVDEHGGKVILLREVHPRAINQEQATPEQPAEQPAEQGAVDGAEAILQDLLWRQANARARACGFRNVDAALTQLEAATPLAYNCAKAVPGQAGSQCAHWCGDPSRCISTAAEAALATPSPVEAQREAESAGCDYQGYEFGAGSYPDSVCIGGSLHDADDGDNEGNVYLNPEDIPCPVCRPADAIEYWADRNALFVQDDETEEEGLARARESATSLVNDIRKNRGLEPAPIAPSAAPAPSAPPVGVEGWLYEDRAGKRALSLTRWHPAVVGPAGVTETPLGKIAATPRCLGWGCEVTADPKIHQSQLVPADNKFHAGNGSDGKHYWLTPPALYATLDAEFRFTFDPCPCPLPAGFDGLTTPWGASNYVNPPFGSIMHQGPGDKKPKKKGPTAWVRKAIAEHQEGKRVVLVYPVDKWLLMLLAAGAQVRNLGDVRWHATEDGSEGKGTGRHIACFVLDHDALASAARREAHPQAAGHGERGAE